MNHLQRPLQIIRQNKKIAIVGGIAALLVLSFGIIALNGSEDKKGTVAQKQSQNWLKPTDTINVGQLRYVSPCSVLPKDAVESAFGDLTSSADITESYLERSRQADATTNDYLDTSCVYNYPKSSGKLVEFSVEQYLDIDSINLVSISLGVEPDDNDALVNRIAEATSGSSNETKQFVSKLKSSAKTLRDAEDNPQVSTNPGIYNGVVAIDPESIDDGGFKMIVKYNNVRYALRYVPERSTFNSTGAYSDQQLATIMNQLGKSYTQIIKNASNTKLDQSPAPTVLGSSNKMGSTTLLESCSVLDAAAYRAAFGIDDNEPIKRYGLPENASTVTRKDGIANRVSGNCIRVFSDNEGSSKQVDFNLLHSPSAADAKKKNDDYLKGYESSIERVQTSADYTIIFQPNEPDPSYYFGVGPYTGVLRVSEKNGYDADDDVATDRQAALRTIDQLVANIKRDQKNAR